MESHEVELYEREDDHVGGRCGSGGADERGGGGPAFRNSLKCLNRQSLKVTGKSMRSLSVFKRRAAAGELKTSIRRLKSAVSPLPYISRPPGVSEQWNAGTVGTLEIVAPILIGLVKSK